MPADPTYQLRENAPEPPDDDALHVSRGTVKWWRDAKGYGVISVPELAPWDIWCHFSAIEAEGFRNLTEGEAVEVEYYRFNQYSFKYLARSVRRV
jgi:CspA family cold shock protein